MSRGRKWERPPHLGSFLKIPQKMVWGKNNRGYELKTLSFPAKKMRARWIQHP